MANHRSKPRPLAVAQQSLFLTSTLRADAAAVVNSINAINWESRATHDKVELNFPDDHFLKLAEEVIREIAVGNDILFELVLAKFRCQETALKRLQIYINEVLKMPALAKDPRTKKVGQAKKLGKAVAIPELEQVRAKSTELEACNTKFNKNFKLLHKLRVDPRALNDWQSLNKVLTRIAGIEKEVMNNVAQLSTSSKRAGKQMSFPQQPGPNSCVPVEVAERGHVGLSLIAPIELAFASEVVSLCRKIGNSSQQTSEIKVDGDEMLQVRKYERLFLKCGFAKFSVPTDEDNPQSGAMLERGLDKLLATLRAFLRCLPPENSAVGTDNSLTPGKPEKPGEIPADNASTPRPATQPEVNDCHKISIDDDCNVTVDGKIYTRDRNGRSLIGFALFASHEKPFRINTGTYIEAVEGPDRKWSHRWKERTDALDLDDMMGSKNVKRSGKFRCTKKTSRQYQISGLCFIQKPSREKIEKYLSDNPFPTRNRRDKTK